MSTETLKIVGQVAGIGGIGLGILFLLYRDVIRLKVFPELTRRQAYSVIVLLLVLIWSIALSGVAAWVWIEVRTKPIPEKEARESDNDPPRTQEKLDEFEDIEDPRVDQEKNATILEQSTGAIKEGADVVTPVEVPGGQGNSQDEGMAYMTCRLQASRDGYPSLPTALWVEGFTYRVASDSAVHNLLLKKDLPKDIRVRCAGRWRDASIEAKIPETCIVRYDC